MPGFSTPDWAKGAVMYQIYMDRFCNGDPYNDVETSEYFYIGDYSTSVTDWNKYPAAMGVREFYGGDMKGVLDKLDYFRIWEWKLCILTHFLSLRRITNMTSQDYDYIDPHLWSDCRRWRRTSRGCGDNDEATKYQIRTDFSLQNLEASNALFIQLVEELHRRGMKIILDGVFNHCGSFNKWMDRERIYENQQGYETGSIYSEKQSVP